MEGLEADGLEAEAPEAEGLEADEPLDPDEAMEEATDADEEAEASLKPLSRPNQKVAPNTNRPMMVPNRTFVVRSIVTSPNNIKDNSNCTPIWLHWRLITIDIANIRRRSYNMGESRCPMILLPYWQEMKVIQPFWHLFGKLHPFRLFMA